MKAFNQFPFFLGPLALLFVLLGFIVKSPDTLFSGELALGGAILAIVYWIWIIKEINKSTHLQPGRKMMWLIITISVPFFGAVIYQLTGEEKDNVTA